MTQTELSSFIWSVADLIRGPYRPPQYERVMLPMTVLRRFDCVLEKNKPAVLKRFKQLEGGKSFLVAYFCILNTSGILEI